MQLREVAFSSVHFPIEEWQWLRAPVALDTKTANTFLFGCEIGSKIYAWTANGTAATATSPSSKITVVLFEAKSETEAFGLWLKTAATIQPLSDAEWISVFKVHADMATPEMKQKFERFKFYSRAEIKFLFEKKFDAPVLELVEVFTPELRTAFLNALKKYDLSAANTKELTGNILVVSKKLGERAALSLLNGQFGSGDELRNAVFRTGQPEMFAIADERVQKLRALKPPPRTAVHGDPGFDNDAIKITHSPKNATDIELFKNWIENPETIEKFRQLLEIYQQ